MPSGTSDLAEMKRVTYRFAVDAWMGDPAIFDEVCASDYSLGKDMTLDNLKQVVAECHAAMPDFHVDLGTMIAEGDKVAYRWTMSGTHLGEYRGIAATGRKLQATGITILQFRDGKIIHDEFESGGPGFDEQLK